MHHMHSTLCTIEIFDKTHIFIIMQKDVKCARGANGDGFP